MELHPSIEMAFHPRHFLDEYTFTRHGFCDLCGDKIFSQSSACHCPTCKSCFHKDCLTITYPKIHEHTLTFIHRENHFVCDACGSIHADTVNMFGCLQCSFFVHKKCIFLPRAIKITRHPHRLSHTFGISGSFCISDAIQHCGVCHKIFNKSYGGYTCLNKVCNYVIHSDCATDELVWDGKDVNGEPEEVVKSLFDLASFIEINDSKIHHFSHDHHDLISFLLDVEKDSSQICQACILPVDFGKFFACEQCDYALHDACARLPRMMEYLLHRHPLTLQIYDINMMEGFFTCSTCKRDSCGFMYQCCQEGCGFKIDVRCASLVEPFIHSVHPHPLFLRQNRDRGICNGCHHYSDVADCRTCYFALDLACITLPKLIKHKYDVHPLSLSQHKILDEESDMMCELCENIIIDGKLFYTCHDCVLALHVKCTIGRSPYLKPGHWIKVNGFEIKIASNNGHSRPICDSCVRVCLDKLVFKFVYNDRDICLCSMSCLSLYSTIRSMNCLSLDSTFLSFLELKAKFP